MYSFKQNIILKLKGAERLGAEEISYNNSVSKVSIVGAGMMSNPGVAAKMFECLYNSNINARLGPGQSNYICINGPLKLFIHKNRDDVVVSSVCPKKDQADADFFDLPHHIFEIIASFLGIELGLYSMGIHESDFSREDYVFNLKLLCGSFVSIGERT